MWKFIWRTAIKGMDIVGPGMALYNHAHYGHKLRFYPLRSWIYHLLWQVHYKAWDRANPRIRP